MISASVSVEGLDEAIKVIARQINELKEAPFVTVGIHEGAGDHPDSDITMASLGAVHEFGASINHPGGTNYGYADEQAAQNNQVRFLASGTGYAVLGVTQPHKIEIPARSWLRPGVESGSVDYINIIADGLEHGENLGIVMNRVGTVAAAKVQQYMVELRTPPNAPSTIRRKGSSNPLIDSGALRQSVTYTVTPTKPEEGI